MGVPFEFADEDSQYILSVDESEKRGLSDENEKMNNAFKVFIETQVLQLFMH